MRRRKIAIVSVNASLLRSFRRRAKLDFPLEAYGILFGYVDKTVVVVESIHMPTNAADVATEKGFAVSHATWQEARTLARRRGLSLVGDIHSHTFFDDSPIADCSPSQIDLDGFDRDYVQAVVTVTRCGEKLHTRCRWWIAGPYVVAVIQK